jgi:REP element-mobilizing transposase RayT
MSKVIAYHVILSNHGFWLPNDPRGSCSVTVRYDPLKAFGEATTVEHTRFVARDRHDRRLRLAAKLAMKYPEVVFTGRQAQAVGHGFARQVAKSGYTVHACAIMPNHAHLVIARHRYRIEQVVRLLRQSATERLLAANLHPFADQRAENGRLPSVWGQDFWKVFLFEPEDVDRAIRYTERNPVRDGLPPQKWSFVTLHQREELAYDASSKRR